MPGLTFCARRMLAAERMGSGTQARPRYRPGWLCSLEIVRPHSALPSQNHADPGKENSRRTSDDTAAYSHALRPIRKGEEVGGAHRRSCFTMVISSEAAAEARSGVQGGRRGLMAPKHSQWVLSSED